ncbi:MAG TPA: UDP-N-acetylmuramate:L-alanyl-gamma-D-glutamyl-meso-diaminopimelate ligase [Gammaproteobacteria bacterium]|nr:UDP-N-acetylmuramate:L-alanyl-gamma-D-glutamyl-meso-diaminopimelate ligase [Gammaproteobacteria bacterium]
MHIHILGICGTFMGGVAALAQAAGHRVTGSDANVYPPMSDQLRGLGIELLEGWDPAQLKPEPDFVLIGNALSRGNPCVEAVLEQGLPYTSGAQWLADHVLRDRWVLAVAGTHGKTTTASMLAWILEYAGLKPGFLIGGIAPDFGVSARLGEAPFFVVEADEYDTAFFDKRSKFIHYRPRTLVLNNLEYDHADIFDNLAAIQKQFHHLVRTVPGNGRIFVNAQDANLRDTLAMGCWTPRETFSSTGSGNWNAHALNSPASRFEISVDRIVVGEVNWALQGEHNMQNALAALAAARHAGVPVEHGIAALNNFKGVKRRMELRGEINGIQVFDDFAHHPTAIKLTLDAAQNKAHKGRVIAVLEPRSNSMKLGAHRDEIAPALAAADAVFLYQAPFIDWPLQAIADQLNDLSNDVPVTIGNSIEELVTGLLTTAQPNDQIIIMSNGGFGGIHEKLLTALEKQYASHV